MVLFNYSTKELTAKIVYYGPGLCGKTTNLQYIFSNLPPNVHKGKMLSLATQTDRTLFFDFLPIDLGTIRGMKTRLQLYTVPGQVFYNTTRKLVLKGADGLVFVADSQRKMLEADIESFNNLEENLREHGMELSQIPHVLQFNKRDLGNLLSAEDLNAGLNKYNAPIYEAVATTGIGVHDTLKAVTRLVLNSLKEKYEGKKPAVKTAPPPPAGATTMESPSSARSAPRPPETAAKPVEEEPVLEITEEAQPEAVLEVEPDEAVLEIEPEPAPAEEAVLEVEEEPEEIEIVEEPSAPLAAIEVEQADEEPAEVLQVEEEPEEEPEEVLEMEAGIDESAPVELNPVEVPEEEPVLGSLVEEQPRLSAGGFPTGPFPPSPLGDGATMAVSVETRNMPAVSPGEVTIPLSLNIQGRTVNLRVTISVQVEPT